MYEKQTWANGRSGGTPASADALNHLETQYDELAADVVDTDTPVGEAVAMKYGAYILATEYGAIGDGATDNSAALAAALLAAEGQALYLPAGEYRVTSATRLVLKGNFSSIVGDPSGPGTIIRFTHADGGLDIGDGTNNVYENRLNDILLTGHGVATTLVRMQKVYEPYFSHTRIENCAGTLILMDDCGQFDADRLVMATAPIGIRTTGTTSPVANIRLGNFYMLTEAVKFEGSGIAKFAIKDSWVEACPDLFVVNTSGAFSIGEVIANGVRILKASGDQRLFRFLASTSLNAQVINFDRVYVSASASTAPLFDFTAAVTAGTVRVSMDGATVLYANTGFMLQVHGSQTFSQMLTDFSRINGLSAALWSPTSMTSSFPRPAILHGSGVPAIAAPGGSLYMRNDTAAGFYPPLYVKMATAGTAWRAVGTQRAIATKTSNYTIADTDEIIISNGSSLVMTLPNPGLHTGRFFTVKNIHSSSATVGPGTGTIDGAATVTLVQWETATFVSNGTGVWYRI